MLRYRGMNTATISIGVDPVVKKAAAGNAKAAGMNLSAIIRGIVNRLAKEPEAVYEYHYPNATTRKAIDDLENGIGVTRVTDLEELYKELDRD